MVTEGRGLDVGLFGTLAYRVDGLGVVLGVGWCLGMALAAGGVGDALRGDRWVGVYSGLMTVGALNVFYARLPFVLYLGWELAGAGLWLTMKQGLAPARYRREVAWVLHASGWPLLLLVGLGLVLPFAPPAGGVAQAWSATLMLGVAVVILVRSGCPPFDAWVRRTRGRYSPLLALYAVIAPVVIAKMLVAAPWDPFGAWALAFAGTAMLLGSVLAPFLQGEEFGIGSYASAYSAMALVGFALAAGSPLGAAGGVALALVGMVTATFTGRNEVRNGLFLMACALLGAIPGVWLLTQGALGLGYGIIAAIMLPAAAGLWFVVRSKGNGGSKGDSRTASTFASMVILISVAFYPQGLVEFVLRPAVGAMAGGVGTLTNIRSDWGVGLELGSAQGVAQAGLPATGIAVGVFLAWVALYWLRGLLTRLASGQHVETEAE